MTAETRQEEDVRKGTALRKRLARLVRGDDGSPEPARERLQVMIRVVADFLIIQAAVLAALVIRIMMVLSLESRPREAAYFGRVFRSFATSYVQSGPILTLICLAVFYKSGFYTRGRFYEGRYKALVIVQGAALSFLLFTVVAYVIFPSLTFPRGVLLLAWFICSALLLTARFWSSLWRKVVNDEEGRMQAVRNTKISRVLVIGGAGYIGSSLVPRLLDMGYQVRVLDLLLFGEEPLAAVWDHPNLEIRRADLRHVNAVVQAMRDVDAVVHLGAIVGDPACALDEELTIEVNLMATRMIAEVAKGSGVQRFIFASTCSVYGAADEVLDERSAVNPVSLYARSKVASEKVLLKLADEHFAPMIFRFATIYGLSGRTRFDLVVNVLTATAVTEDRINVFGGDQWRPFLHVHDAALAIALGLQAPLSVVQNKVYNVGSNQQNHTLLEAAEAVRRLVPSAELVAHHSEGDRRNYKVDFSAIHDELGFEPEWSLDQGIQQVIDALRSGRIKAYQEAQYSNVKFLGEATVSRLIAREGRWVYEILEDDAGMEKAST